MKIVFTHTDYRAYYPPRLLALQTFLEARGDELYIVEVSKESVDYGFSDNDKSMFHHHEFLFDSYKTVSAKEMAKAVEKRLDEIMPDIVFFVSIAFPSGAAAVRWGVRHDRPVVSMDNAQKETFQRSALNHFVKKRIYKYVSAYITPSDRWDESMFYWGFRNEQLFYGLNVADDKFWREPTHEQVEYKDYFLSVGRQVEKKNHIVVLQAYKEYCLRERENAKQLLLIGDGPERERLEQYVAQNNLSGVVFMPFLSPARLRPYYHNAALFILASNREETFGLVVNEAMHAGCPVIVSDQCGCATTLVEPHHNGYIVPTGDSMSMAEAMIEFEGLSDERKRAMSSASLKIISHWGLDRFVGGVTSAADYAINRNKRRRLNPLDRLIITLWDGRFNY